MNETGQGIASVAGRLLLVLIFLMSALMSHIPNFGPITEGMREAGVPLAAVSHVIAIALMLLGGLSVLIGCWARIGALMLLVFLALAAFFFHDFWNLTGEEMENERNHFMKNVAMMGAMLFIVANGPGAWSLDNRPPRIHAD